MGECNDAGAAVGALASHLIDDTMPGYVTIGSQWADIGPDLQKFDDLADKSFSGVYAELGQALNKVAVPGQGGAAPEINTPTISANGAFANMERVATDVDNWDGLAATSFVDNYKTQLPYVADHQFTIIKVLIAGLEAQKELYDLARANVLSICQKTLSSLEAIDARDKAVAALGLTVLAAAGSITVEIMSGGLATPVIIAVAEAAGVGASAMTIDYNTDDPRVVMDKFYEAIKGVYDHFRSRETEIRAGWSNVAKAVQTDLDRRSWGEVEFPGYRFKPTGFAHGPGHLGNYHP